jgi:hypothetical protein
MIESRARHRLAGRFVAVFSFVQAAVIRSVTAEQRRCGSSRGLPSRGLSVL